MSSITLHYSNKDPKATKYSVIVNSNAPNYISNIFYTFPLYDESNFQVGYRVSTVTCQQVDENLYMITQKNTNNIYNQGSISTCYVYTDNVPYVTTPPGIYTSSIVSTTGSYLGKTGSVNKKKFANETTYVNIFFANN